MMLDRITPVILTYNEEANIARTLEQLRWARQVVVLDSLSTDRTRALATGFANVAWFERAFTFHADQWNHAVQLAGNENDWVLALDADYVLSGELVQELSELGPDAGASAYACAFDYCIAGRVIRSGIYPPAPVLFRPSRARYVQDGHTQRLQVSGTVGRLTARIRHDDRKPFRQWLAGQRRYAALEAGKLLNELTDRPGWNIRLRRWHVITPWLVPLYCLAVRGGVLDGWQGFYYAFQRSVAEHLISWALLRARWRKLTARRAAL